MQLGMVGLGRMGSGMTKRLEQHGPRAEDVRPERRVDREDAGRSRSSSSRRGTSG